MQAPGNLSPPEGGDEPGDRGHPLEAAVSKEWLKLWADTITALIDLNVAKHVYPGVMLQSLSRLKLNATAAREVSYYVRESLRCSLSRVTYGLSLLLPGLALETEHTASCLEEYARQAAQADRGPSQQVDFSVQRLCQNYFTSVLRSGDCTFWHTPGNDKAWTLHELQRCIWDLDFAFLNTPEEEVVNTLREVEEICGKVYTALWVLPPHILDVTRECLSCSAADAFAYAVPHGARTAGEEGADETGLGVRHCTHLVSAETVPDVFHSLHMQSEGAAPGGVPAPEPGSRHVDGGVGAPSDLEAHVSEMALAVGAPRPPGQADPTEDRYYNGLGQTVESDDRLISELRLGNRHVAQKTKALLENMRRTRGNVDRNWRNSGDVFRWLGQGGSGPAGQEDVFAGNAVLMYTVPVYGLTVEELVRNEFAAMDSQADINARNNELRIREELERARDGCLSDVPTDPACHILRGINKGRDPTASLSCLLATTTGNDLRIGDRALAGEAGLMDADDAVGSYSEGVVAEMSSCDIDQVHEAAGARVFERCRMQERARHTRLLRRLRRAKEDLHSCMDPRVAGDEMLSALFAISRCLRAVHLFREATGAVMERGGAHGVTAGGGGWLVPGDGSPPTAPQEVRSEAAEAWEVSCGEPLLETVNVSVASELTKSLQLGPMWINRDSHEVAACPVRAGFVMHAVWAARGVPASARAELERFCTLKAEKGALGSGRAERFGDLFPVMRERLSQHLEQLARLDTEEERSQQEGEGGDRAERLKQARFLCHLHKIRLAACAVVAHQVAHPDKRVRCLSVADPSHITPALGGEVYALEEGLYVGPALSPHTLVTRRRQPPVGAGGEAQAPEWDIKQSYDVFELLAAAPARP